MDKAAITASFERFFSEIIPHCEISSQCVIISVNNRSNEAVIAALSVFNIDKTNLPELFI